MTRFPHIRPVCLPDSAEDYAGQLAVVTGWGTMSSGGQTSDKLRAAEVNVLSNTQCQASALVPLYSNGGFFLLAGNYFIMSPVPSLALG